MKPSPLQMLPGLPTRLSTLIGVLVAKGFTIDVSVSFCVDVLGRCVKAVSSLKRTARARKLLE